MPDAPRLARLRAEYTWPYPAIRTDVWYRISAKPDDDPGYCWLQTKPSPTYVQIEHLEIAAATAAIPSPSAPTERAPRVLDAEAPERQARLRPETSRRYGGVLPGVWIWARDMVSLVRLSAKSLRGERRQRRLPASDFEFRDADSGPDDSPLG
jgi:hypothetical protein